ncbi:MAG: hypothetical protein IT218_02615 [Ignavibacteria bacterium]|nr:hypothetical protein [Ignavibacteria bacterium]
MSTASLSYQTDGTNGKFGIRISPFGYLNDVIQENISKSIDIEAKDYANGLPMPNAGFGAIARAVAEKIKQEELRTANADKMTLVGSLSSYGISLLSPRVLNTSSPQFTGQNYRVAVRTKISPIPFLPGEVGLSIGFEGSYARQETAKAIDGKAYGMLYLGRTKLLNAEDRKKVLYDYTSDRENPFTQRDRYLYAPSLSPDVYRLSGESLGGSFQAHNRKVGVVHPAQRSSNTTIIDVSLRLGFGTANGVGGVSTAGFQKIKVMPWTSPSSYAFANYTDTAESWYDGEPVFFRFVGDLGGYIQRTSTTKPERLSASRSGVVFDTTGTRMMVNAGARSGRSSNISYVTNREMAAQASGGYYRRARTPSSRMNLYMDRSEPAIADQVGEFSVTNEGGVTYTYGLPVYARNEKSLYYGTVGNWGDILRTNPSQDRAYYAKAKVVSGQIKLDPYASTHLLTQIVSSDYVDRSGNGPSPDDYGSYTLFNYKRTAGTYTKSYNSGDSSFLWYRWRSPYTAQLNSEGRLIDNKLPGDARDNRGIVNSGEKEVYFLESVETKTHKAYFVTNKTNLTVTTNTGSTAIAGSFRERLDAYEAYNPPVHTSEEALEKFSAAKSYEIQTGFDGVYSSEFAGRTYNGTLMSPSTVMPKHNKNEYLERIELWSRDTAGVLQQLIQTARFEYNYSTMMAGTGKWYSVDTTTNDTTFHYSAPTDLNSAVGLTTHNLWPVTEETALGVFRYGKLTLRRVWFEYGGVKAARIAPYEFEYRYPLQSQFASHIASQYPAVLSDFPTALTGYDSATGWHIDKENLWYDEKMVDRWGFIGSRVEERLNKRFDYVDQVPETNFDPAAWNLKQIRLPSGGRIIIQYEQNDYRHVQNEVATSMADVKHLHEDDYKYVEVDVASIGIAPHEISDYCKLLRDHIVDHRLLLRALYLFNSCSAPSSGVFPEDQPVDFVNTYLRAVSADQYGPNIRIYFSADESPADAAVDYARANRVKDFNCDGELRGGVSGDFEDPEFWTTFVTSLLPGAQLFSQFQVPSAEPLYEFTSLRLPVFKRKLGGGIRVKRLLMYDEGLEAGDEVLYGSEYIYKQWENIAGKDMLVSSGVASNEPMRGREENALVQPLLQRSEQDWLDVILYGSDIDKFEGPLVGSFLPAPSITYAQVVVQSIHTGETNTGHTVTTFWTWRDHPVTIDYTDVSVDQITPVPVIDFMNSVSMTKYYASQGYAVNIPSMNGKQRATRQCAGRFNTAANVTAKEVAAVEYEYFAQSESLPVLDSGVFGGIGHLPLGVEEEVTIENRNVTDVYETHSLSIDGGFTIPSVLVFIPTPFFTAAYTYKLNDQACATNVMTKVITYPAVVKKTIQRYRGMKQETENIAFDPLTGRPMITRTYDGFDQLDLEESVSHTGTISSITVPASSIYTELGQAAQSERLMKRNVTYTKVGPPFSPEFILTYPTAASAIHAKGDLILVREGSTVRAVGHVISLVSSNVNCQAVSWSPSIAAETAIVTVEVLRPGRRNLLTATAGSVVAYGLDRDFFNTSTSIFADLEGVLSANATKWTDTWTYVVTPTLTSTGSYAPTAYQTGFFGRFGVSTSWAYLDSTIASTGVGKRIYLSGGTSSSWTPFSWTSSNSAQWIRTDSVTMVSVDAAAVESRNAIGIYSSATYSHDRTMPAMVAANAGVSQIHFVSYEDSLHVDSTVAHTGKRSRKLTDSTAFATVGTITTTVPLNEGFAIRFWLKSQGTAVAKIGSTTRNAVFVARSGDWCLVESRFTAADLTSETGQKTVSIRLAGAELGWIDDIRVLPVGSQGTGFAYDRQTLRLIAQFDESHFATIYQYDGQGRLVRLMKETERGIKTVKDGAYHQPQLARSTSTGVGPASFFSVMRRFGSMGVSDGERIIGNELNKIGFPDMSPSGVGGQFDVLQMNIGLDSSSTSVFGKRVDTLLPKLPKPVQRDTTKKTRGQR